MSALCVYRVDNLMRTIRLYTAVGGLGSSCNSVVHFTWCLDGIAVVDVSLSQRSATSLCDYVMVSLTWAM